MTISRQHNTPCAAQRSALSKVQKVGGRLSQSSESILDDKEEQTIDRPSHQARGERIYFHAPAPRLTSAPPPTFSDALYVRSGDRGGDGGGGNCPSDAVLAAACSPWRGPAPLSGLPPTPSSCT